MIATVAAASGVDFALPYMMRPSHADATACLHACLSAACLQPSCLVSCVGVCEHVVSKTEFCSLFVAVFLYSLYSLYSLI